MCTAATDPRYLGLARTHARYLLARFGVSNSRAAQPESTCREMAVNSGDRARARGHHGDDDEEGVAVVGEDYPYCSDSDSDDDDDVDRYVFLARQPAPPVDRDDAEADAGAEGTGCCKRKRRVVDDDDDDDGFSPRQPALLDGSGGQAAEEEEDDEGSSDDDDAMAPRGEAGGGGRGRGVGKVSRKKARLVDLIRSPLLPAELDGSDKAAPPPPRGVCPKKIAVVVQAKNRKRRRFVDGGEEQEPQPQPPVRGKRSRGPDLEASEGLQTASAAAAAAAAEAAERASKRFVCSICGRCFGSHQALGGHVLGHKKKAKNAAIAAAARDATTTAVTEAVAPASQRQSFFAADINGQDERGCDGAEGSRYDDDEEKSPVVVDDVAACHDADVDESRGHGKAESASAIDAGGDAGNNKVAHGDGEENDKIAGVVVASSHDGDSDVGKMKIVQHKCDECGKVCLTGQALGGHMSKHRRTRPAANGGEGPATATVADGGAQTVRLIGDDVCLQRAVAIAGFHSAQ